MNKGQAIQNKVTRNLFRCDNLGSHGDNYEDNSFLGYSAVYSR
jgi:hypothetical protein